MYFKTFSPALIAVVLLSLTLLVAPEKVGGQDQKQQSLPTLKRSEEKEESKRQSEDVLRIDTDLTNLFFSAVDITGDSSPPCKKKIFVCSKTVCHRIFSHFNVKRIDPFL
jgi:hypothetical protein